MLDFNSYISGLFGRKSNFGETRQRLEGVIDTLSKQLSLLGGRDSLVPAFKANTSKDIVVDVSAITKGDSLLSGEEFNAGMDKLTGQCLVQAQARKDYGKDFYRFGSEAAKTLFGAEVAQLASAKIANQWRGFGKCVAKAMMVSDAQNKTATEEILDAVRSGDIVAGTAKAFANWRQGGKAGQALGLTNDLMEEIRESMIPQEGESLVAATMRTEKWLSERLRRSDPQPEDGQGQDGQGQDGQGQDGQGQDGQDQDGQGQDGQDQDGQDQDGQGQDGQDQDGQGQDGQDQDDQDQDGQGQDGQDQDGQGQDGQDQDGQGQDGQDQDDQDQDGQGQDGQDQDGQDKDQNGAKETKETKSVADLLRDVAAANPSKPKARGAKSGSFNPLDKIENKRTIDGVPLAKIQGKEEYKINEAHTERAVQAGMTTNTKWHSAAGFLTYHADRFPASAKPTMAKAELAYKNQINQEKRAISQVADCISFPNRDTAMPEYGMRSGDIDEANLWSLAAGISHRVFSRSEVISKPKALIVLLLDLSGSMASGNKIIEAAMIIRLIIEAWQNLRLDGAELCVYGHTAELKDDSLDMVRIFDRTEDGRTILCGDILQSAMNQNLDGYAVHAALTEAWKVHPDIKPSETSLIVVSDGEPMASCLRYHDEDYGIAHTAHVVSTHRKSGVHIEGIGICNAFTKDVGEAMYGKGNCVILNDTLSGLPILTKMIKRICDR
jgi:hypothetical protein